jgi:hypothetical protein
MKSLEFCTELELLMILYITLVIKGKTRPLFAEWDIKSFASIKRPPCPKISPFIWVDLT